MQKNHPKLIDDFRVLQFPACAAAFKMPVDTKIVGQMTSGAMNNVQLRVVSLSDFMIMKSHAIGGRDKPKDVYDLCHCLDVYPGGITALGDEWRRQRGDPLTDQAVQILRDKFQTVDYYGPNQLVIFHDSHDPDQDAAYARRAYELVQKLLGLV
jgi:predicted nucleotidyltransferase component of viral defense system